MNAPVLALKELVARLRYEPKTGLFRWLMKSSRVSVGDVAGCVNARGYVVIRTGAREYRAHRLAWLFMTGEWPDRVVDHRDGNPSNNAFSNLRAVDDCMNAQNQRKAKSTNKLGVLGVHQRGNRFRSAICVRGKAIRLGTHATPELAHAAYLQAKRELHEGNTL